MKKEYLGLVLRITRFETKDVLCTSAVEDSSATGDGNVSGNAWAKKKSPIDRLNDLLN